MIHFLVLGSNCMTWKPYFSTSSGDQKVWPLVLRMYVAVTSTFLPVYSFVSLSHSSKTKISPSFTSKSARRNSNFFLPEIIFSKYSRQTFLWIVAIFLIFNSTIDKTDNFCHNHSC